MEQIMWTRLFMAHCQEKQTFLLHNLFFLYVGKFNYLGLIDC